MALHQPALGHRAQEFVRVVLIVVAAIAVMVLATVIFGDQTAAPSFELVPDPAGVSLPF